VEYLVGVLAFLVLVDLVLSFGIIRRLRQHDDALAGSHTTHGSGLPAGSPVPEFATASGTAGESISVGWFHDHTSLVAFHAENCGACEEQLPALRDGLRKLEGRGVRALIVVPNFDKEATAKIDELTAAVGDLASIVSESPSGPLHSAFRVKSYPSHFIVGMDGAVAGHDHQVGDLLRSVDKLLPEVAARTS
jgi:hypothetical protein